MLEFFDKKSLTKHLTNIRKNKSIGFVPTMGALHEGHIALIKNSKQESDITVCSIFINPTQFNNNNDFINYPKNTDKDLSLLKKNNCDIVYIPKVEDLYTKSEEPKTYNFNGLETVMEGKHRPGHFNGVATIVEKLFNIMKPEKAFFGEKDLQQLQIVKELVKKMKVNTIIKSIPTVRELSGLAKSSRNALLTQAQKEEASIIYKTLLYCKQNKQIPIKELKKHATDKIISNKSIKLEYIEFINLETMRPIKSWREVNKNAICIAAYINRVRLIDNIIL